MEAYEISRVYYHLASSCFKVQELVQKRVSLNAVLDSVRVQRLLILFSCQTKSFSSKACLRHSSKTLQCYLLIADDEMKCIQSSVV